MDDVNIIVFRQINQFDLSGNVITSSEYLSTLWVRVLKKTQRKPINNLPLLSSGCGVMSDGFNLFPKPPRNMYCFCKQKDSELRDSSSPQPPLTDRHSSLQSSIKTKK